MALYPDDNSSELEAMKKRWPKKFWPETAIFERIHPGDRIFVGTGCGEPQHLVGALKRYVEKRPNSLTGAEHDPRLDPRDRPWRRGVVSGDASVLNLLLRVFPINGAIRFFAPAVV
mgnify:CR=1 FL=1